MGIRSFQKNETIFAFFTFFIKERNILFGFISHTKIANLAKKECKRKQRSFYKVKKECSVLFSLYIYIYTSIYLYISIYIYIYKYLYMYLYIYIYIEKRTEHSAFFCKRTKSSSVILRSLQKKGTFFTFISVLLKRTKKNGTFFWVS